jgi:diguanylate cyclase (GGDEF)-like protein
MPNFPLPRSGLMALAATTGACVAGALVLSATRSGDAAALPSGTPIILCLLAILASALTGTGWQPAPSGLSPLQWRWLAARHGWAATAPGAMAFISASRIMDADPAFCMLTGYGAGACVESLDLSPALLDDLAGNAADGGGCTVVTRLRTCSGGGLEARVSARSTRVQRRTGILLLITDARPMLRKRDLDETDPMTGLPGRKAMERHMATRIGPRAARSALLSLDLDRFHAVNDLHGYTMGDEVVCRMAERLRASAAPGAIVGRMGGDKFAIIAPIDIAEDALAVAQAAQDAICAALPIGDATLYMSSGIGICVAPDDATDPDTARRRADLALYRAKDTAQGTICRFEPFMAAAAVMRATLEADLHSAIAGRELFLEYQPQFRAHSEELLGFEALLRWRHPKRGIVPPLQFIGLAEQSALIGEIGRWVLREACLEATRWPSHLHVAVNVSAAQFQQDDMADVVAETLRECGLAAHRLELELTESIMLTNQARNLDMLRRLRAGGTPISMDDFGTGYCSLTYLRQFPFNRIKIDRSFVRDMVHDSATRSIVQVIISMSEALDVAVVAEGVETTAQLDLLRSLNCGQIQGYLFGRPAPIAYYADLVARSITAHPLPVMQIAS